DEDAGPLAGSAKIDFPLPGVIDGPDAGGAPDDDNLVFGTRGTEPIEPARVIAYATSVEHLMQRHGGVNHRHRGSVLWRKVVHVVRRQHVSRPRHVLDDHRRLARYVTRHVAGNGAGKEVVG